MNTRGTHAVAPSPAVHVRYLGCVDYACALADMQSFNHMRKPQTADQIWVCQHPPVFTLGLAGRPEHLLRDIGIPIVHTDRGGQITYHGPGQAIAYLLLDLRRRGLGVREWVTLIEQAVIDLLAHYGISAQRKPGAPGVYVHEAKIAALGLRIKNGCCYHGVAVNVDMNLSPFAAINPCGFAGLSVTQIADLGKVCDTPTVSVQLAAHLQRVLTQHDLCSADRRGPS
jgi:lipoyl(octanoyl) transferase